MKKSKTKKMEGYRFETRLTKMWFCRPLLGFETSIFLFLNIFKIEIMRNNVFFDILLLFVSIALQVMYVTRLDYFFLYTTLFFFLILSGKRERKIMTNN